MYVAEIDKIKLDLIKWISSLEDLDQLNMMESIRLSWSETSRVSWDDLPEWEKREVEKGLKELDEGQGIPSEEFWRKFKSELAH